MKLESASAAAVPSVGAGRMSCVAMLLWMFVIAPSGLAFEADAPAASPEPPAPQILLLVRLPPIASQRAEPRDEGAALRSHRQFAAAIAAAHGLRLVDRWPIQVLGVDCFVMALPATAAPLSPQSARAIADMLSHDPRVAWAQPMQLGQAVEDAGSPR